MSGLPILEHLKKLKDKALEENKKRHNEMAKYKKYYLGKKDNISTQLNIIKGIVDTKTSLVLDSEIVSSVTPESKSFSDISQLNVLNDIADILNDCNRHVLKLNNFDSIKKDIVKNANIYGLAYVETVWSQDSNKTLGDVKINALNPLDCFPDLSAKKIQDSNYFLIKEAYSSMSLKKKYPQFADKIDKAQGFDRQKDETSNNGKYKNGGVLTVKTEEVVTQMFSDGGKGAGAVNQAKNIVVWKCYLKDDSTFIDEADPEKQQLAFEYPYGRLFMWVEGADDYILEDKAIDYPFGFPIDVLQSDSAVEYIIYIQDRIDKAFLKLQYLIGAFVSFIAHTVASGLSMEEIISNLLIMVDKPGQMEVVTNNTLSEIKTLIDYIVFLKEQANEISRINPAMIAGKREQGVNSGNMVDALNESPMAAIREVQRLFKDFIISQGKKNLILIQLYYTVPRIVRLSGEQLALINPAVQEGDNPLIEVYKKNEQDKYEAIKTINGDLSIGDYDIEVIAGTEMPRSRGEKAKIIMQLADSGIIPKTRLGTDILLNALDVPDKSAILEAQDEANASAPKISMPPDVAAKIFKDLAPQYQEEYLAQFGFSVPQYKGEING